MKAQVQAPYHFVPLSRWVYLPDWAHLVSHDHPFRDGLSGSIALSLTNKTELLVGAESVTKQGQPTQVKWARTPDGTPVIPGSSLKGMVRSFLEAATFAKFKQVDDNRYAYRDISGANTVYSKVLQNTGEAVAAWLKFNSAEAKWEYRKCSHTRLYGQDLKTYLRSQGSQAVIDNCNPEQTTLDKYKILPLNQTALAFELGKYQTRNNKPRDCAVNLGAGAKQGIPVFVGYRPGKESPDLNFNYMFYAVDNQPQEISSRLVNQMFAAHDEELVNYLKTYGHAEYGIPVFIRIQSGKPGNIQAIGLAKMPKMLYDNSVMELAQAQQANLISNDASFDLCELMFGTLRDYGAGLKSRVSFSDSLCTTASQIKESPPVILGQPKASYLNAYLEQTHNNGDVKDELIMYKQGAKLAGWKRYPSQDGFTAHLPEGLERKVNVQSKLELLAPGACFSGKIVFHNLKPVELGALLWALNPGENFYHGLGHGKSLGAGAVQLQAKLEQLHCNADSNPQGPALIQSFIEHMNSQYPAQDEQGQSWQNSPQVQHLLAFGDLEANKGKKLNYMPLQKKTGEVTYSNSKVAGSRKALPGWMVNGQPLPRDESLANLAGYAPRGRLDELVDKLVKDQTLRESMQTAKEKLDKEQAQHELQARKELASPLFKQFLELIEHFERYRGNSTEDANNQVTARHNEITQLLEQAVSAGSGLSLQECKEMHALVSDFELTRYLDPATKVNQIKKPKAKAKHQQKQSLLNQLLSLCNTQ